MVFPEDLEIDPEEEREARAEWLDVAQEEQIAEGDISVSETIAGNDPTPDLDEADEFDELLDNIIDEDDLD